MAKTFTWNKGLSAEVLFQIVLHLVLLLFYTFDKHNHNIQPYQVAYFLNYALCAFIINYVLLPLFFYKKKYLVFLISLVMVISLVISIEELVLEKIYFANSRGQDFPGLFFTLLEVMPLIMILCGFKFAWDAVKKQHEVDELNAMVKESELQYLKSQINPHFLFNNLNNLYSYAIDNSPKTPSIILELSSVLRYMLYDCKENYVPLGKEIEHLKNFIQLSELQIENRGKVEFATENIQSGYQIAPLILNVFVENAFKHSTASQSENISIKVYINLTDKGKLEFECINSFQPQTNTEDLSHGIGLKNVKKRLQLIYPNAHILSIQETDLVYSVKLNIELKKVTV
ncbi:histidine kinase [uncultured Maribacter sp.]|uniref:sensor histidine kinase n=1 Tax=uncultured Maribacter sp. TaxID=431308 RepID=UPI0030D9DB9C|tara:strand:- start:1193 stop:2221 length:1029 start_codon:yes stop_codon:yes gene_type:complete